ncbi:HIT family protein [Robertkochia aurantiaca]|uniref:HIT family protein n=1 Tax=Robertkochia aurantiaca TaxID=2873700 RepID=UPI001CCD9746|nr:HIT family protein [Robertkochia sp. 3YJGBD-33]
MASIFTRIIKGEIPSYKIAENEHCIAFLDVNPNTKGHTLCVPRKEVDKITDLDNETYMELMAFSRKVALAVEKAMDCKRVGIAVIGLEVPHVHVHLIPISKMADMTFQQKVNLEKEEFESIAQQIRSQL